MEERKCFVIVHNEKIGCGFRHILPTAGVFLMAQGTGTLKGALGDPAPIRNKHGLPSGEILLDDVLSGKHQLIKHVRMSYQPSATLSQGWLGKVFGLKDKYNYEVELQLATNPKDLTPSFQPYFTMTVIKAD